MTRAMETSTSQSQSEAQLQIAAAVKRVKAFYEQGRYQESLDACLQITDIDRGAAGAWINAAVNCVLLARWQDAIDYAQTALTCGGNTLALYDALASAHGALGRWDEARRYGLQALEMRDSRFGDAPVLPLPEPRPLPPSPSAQTRERNIIAFSLFGGDSKYCEPAVFNVLEQPNIYPHWVCRFYIDDSVPEDVIGRLRKGGAQIVQVEGPALQWPGPMWRFLALDDPQAHRILLRDDDAVISRREAGAVQQWLASGKRFHMMRDWSSHTELMMAGLWGVAAGSLPPLDQLMERFLSAPLESRHFADQYFLRQYVWPYARASLMQHDSVFGFMNAASFPDGNRPEGFHVGGAENYKSFTAKTDLPNGLEVTWQLYQSEKQTGDQGREELVCAYPCIIKNGSVSASIPARYAQWIEQGSASVRLSVPAAHDAQAKIKSSIDAAAKRVNAFHTQGRYQEALEICLQITRDYPEIADAWGNAAVNCIYLARWRDTIDYGQAALTRGCNRMELYDVLAHAYGELGQWNQARRYGLQALEMRDSRFGGQPAIPPPEPKPLPPSPSAQTRERNIIAFSLFGGDSKYCEPAVLNVLEQPNIYPHWVCRFYVDGSVPENVIDRLRAGGAQIVQVQGPAVQWPGPMWRLLALDDPQAHRILFRDADAVISRREAGAVEQWLASGKRFHMMRDWGSHTELMMAGLWGVVAGSLPPLNELMQRFMSVPLQSQHFADQYFLRQYVWPYARASLMQHDSVFGFMNGISFPGGDRSEGFHVGCAEGSRFFTFKKNLPDGSAVTWALYRIEQRESGQSREELVCSYTNTVQNGTVKACLPARYLGWIQQTTACVRLLASNPA
jgi:tetratricopeptide (TPR) repeat protein